jgi:hypothetical protein
MEMRQMIFYTIENDHEGALFVQSFNDDGPGAGQHVKTAHLIKASSDSEAIVHEVCAELRLGTPTKINHDKTVIFFEVQE